MYKSEIGDRIGSESCGDIDSDMKSLSPCNLRRYRLVEKAETEYPPPIPCLARTENRPSHMPRVMKRYYSGDGRLVITEERVMHHEYLQVYRSNGRLVLNIVPLNDAVEEDQGEEEESEGDDTDGGDELLQRCSTYNNNSLGVNTCGAFAAVLPAAFRPPVRT